MEQCSDVLAERSKDGMEASRAGLAQSRQLMTACSLSVE